MKSKYIFIVTAAILLLSCIVNSNLFAQASKSIENKPVNKHGKLTGEILPVFYVKDVARSVEFYRDKLGFKFNHYYDYEKSKQVTEWKSNEKPIYAQMAAGSQIFALHLYRTPDELNNAGTIHYFEVKDVDAHYKWVTSKGAKPEPLYDRPWMRMFRVIDPDGHVIFFYTRPK